MIWVAFLLLLGGVVVLALEVRSLRRKADARQPVVPYANRLNAVDDRVKVLEGQWRKLPLPENYSTLATKVERHDEAVADALKDRPTRAEIDEVFRAAAQFLRDGLAQSAPKVGL